MQGTRFPKTISTLSESKEITLFVDGDRGGNLIAQNVFDNAKIVYIAQAPDGKEVEELAGKELLQALRKKVPADVFLKQSSRDFRNRNGRKSYSKHSESSEPIEPIERRNITDDDISSLRELASELKGKNILVLNDSLEIVQNVPSSRLDSVRSRDAFILMLSTATSSTIKSAEKLSVKAIAAKTFNKVAETTIDLISL
jgi:DNA primase